MLRGSIVLGACLITAACAGAVASTVGFPSADANDDDSLTTAEFREFFDDTDAFGRYDDNDDGTLNREEYNEAVDDAYEADAYFRGFDTNSDNSLSEDEFTGGWFRLFDGDQSGSLSRSEFERAIDALAVEL